MNGVRRSKILFGIIFLFFLLGCSIPTDFYIQNFTQTKKTVKINYKKGVLKSLSSDYYGVYSFNYINDIVKPKVFKKTKNLKSVDKSVVDSSGIILEIAPQSTVRIEKTHNSRWYWEIDNVEIDGEKFSIQELEKKSDKIRNDYVYKIK